MSRPKRWASALEKAGEGLSMLQQGFSELQDLRNEYEEWQDNLPENLQQSPVAEKLEAIVEIDFESEIGVIEETINQAESCELPLGFGRD